MTIEITPGTVASFEDGDEGGFDFCLYPSKDCLQVADYEERKKLRLLTIVFADLQSFYNFFLVNFQCADRIVAEIMNQPTGKGH